MAKLSSPFSLDGHLIVIGEEFYRIRRCENMFAPCLICDLRNSQCIFKPKSQWDSDCPFAVRDQYLERCMAVTEDMKKEAERLHENNLDASWFFLKRNEGRPPQNEQSHNSDNMEKSKTFIETMDECIFVHGDKFYEPFYCGPEIDPCKCCEIGDCPYTDCPFARYARYLKEVKHVTDDMKSAAERKRSLNPKVDILVLTPEDIQGDGLPTLHKAFDKFWQAVKDAEKSPKPTFRDIAGRIADLQEKKNESYGNAFGQSCNKYGVVSALTRLNDKLNRLDSLYKSSEKSVFGESFTDTLTDLAAYAIMTIEWLENQKNDNLP